jgi:glutathione peroxidase
MALLKSIFIMITSLISGLFADNSEIANRPANALDTPQSLYDFKVKSLVGNKTVDLSQYKGKKVVILNVASKCGYTKQYADWEKFNKEHGDKVVVLGFPSNNFGGQEPGTSEEIATFCSATYGVTFPMFEKVEVKGEAKAPIYKWLTTKDLNGWNDKEPSWNFCKYVVDEKGKLTNFFASKTLPTDAEFLTAVGL